MTVVVLGGEVILAEERPELLDRGVLYGDGVYETLRAYRGRPFMLDEHLARLARSCAVMGIAAVDPAVLRADAARAVAAIGAVDAYVRLTVVRAPGLGLAPPPGASRLVVVAAPLPAAHDEEAARGVRVITVPARFTAVLGAKTTSFAANVWARREAARRGAEDAFALDGDRVLEATGANVVALVGGVLRAPTEGALEGLTRAVVVELARAEGTPVDEAPLSLAELGEASEVALTSSVREVVPVLAIDAYKVGEGTPGPFVTALRARYRAAAIRQTLDLPGQNRTIGDAG